MTRLLPTFLLAFSLILTGCGTTRPVITDSSTTSSAAAPALSNPGVPTQGNATAASLDDYSDDTAVAVFDPIEPWNRFWFRFNDVMLLNVLKPVHEGYVAIMPDTIRSGLSNFKNNLTSPVRFFNSLLQGRFTQAGVEFGRFFINTVTSLGFADVASQSKPRFPYHPRTMNFGHTLAIWGLPEGPYLVWPFLGPSTLRDTVGMVSDAVMTPQNYALTWPVTVSFAAGMGFNSLDAMYIPYQQMKDSALEPYIALRNSYLTLTRKLLQDSYDTRGPHNASESQDVKPAPAP